MVQAVLNEDGSGELIANSQMNPPGETWSWQTCALDLSGCTPFATGQNITTGNAGANTVFDAISSAGATASSPAWYGNAVSIAPPSVTGIVRANELVTPAPGTWDGGWAGDAHFTQLAACADAQGTACTTLTDIHYPGGCANGTAVLDPAFTGEYLRVADQLVGPNPVIATYAVSSPYGPGAWAAGPTTSVAIVGQIAPATGPRTATCGPRPLPSGTRPPSGSVCDQRSTCPPNPSGAGEASVTVADPRANETTASVTVTCTGTASCPLILTLSTIETVKRGKVIAISARTHKSTRRTVTLASKTLMLPADHSETIRLALNGVGRRLLSTRRRLSAKLTVLQGKQPATSRTITFRENPRQRPYRR